MDKTCGSPRCFKNRKCAACLRAPSIDLDAALNELSSLNNNTGSHQEERENLSNRRLLRESRTCFEQSPPLWITNPITSVSSNGGGGPLIVDIEYVKDPPLQPPNSPVSPQLPYEQFRMRDGFSDPVLSRCEYDGRLLAGRRISTKGRQRVLSGPNGNSSMNNGSMMIMNGERMRGEHRAGWRPYRIPRPKLLNMGRCSRLRTISATLHEEPDHRLPLICESTSSVGMTTDALRSMAIDERHSKILDINCESSSTNMNFPHRSRSVESLERRAMDVAPNALDSVSDKIEKLHVA